MLKQNWWHTSLIFTRLSKNYLRVDLVSYIYNKFFHSLVMPIIFFLNGSCYYLDLASTTSLIKSLVHSSLTVARTPQKNIRSGYCLLLMLSTGKYCNTSGSSFIRCQTFFRANSGHVCLKLYCLISLVGKIFFSSNNTLDKKPLEHFFNSGNHLFTNN